VARTTQLAAVLWMSTAGWLTGCGRLWFDPSRDQQGGALADASLPDAPADAAPDASVPDATPGPAPVLEVAPKLTMDIACGSTPEATTLMVTNSGNADLMITNVRVIGDAFTLKVVPLLIAPGTSSAFSIEPPMAVIGTDLGGSGKSATLEIESNAPLAMVELAATVIGANIIVTPPSPLDFTGTSGVCPAPKSFAVKNTGNQTIQVIPEADSPFVFDLSSSLDTFLEPDESLFLDVRPVTLECSGSGNVGFTVSSGTICHADPLLHVNLDIQGSSSCSCS
jgi:hypothetical protein